MTNVFPKKFTSFATIKKTNPSYNGRIYGDGTVLRKIPNPPFMDELKNKMMARIRRGTRKGELVEIMQWCNDWFLTDQGIQSPSSLWFTQEDMEKIRKHDKNGILLTLYRPVFDRKQNSAHMFTFSKLRTRKRFM